jgi:membrane fusion protein (multidrug efflux system)
MKYLQAIKQKWQKKWTFWTAGIAALLAAIFGFGFYNHYHPSTDDAYVNAHVIYIAAQVSGPINSIHIQDHEFVHKGQLLFTIDPRTFQYAVDKAKADLQLARQGMGANADAVKIAQAQVDSNQAQYAWAKANAWRILTLASKGEISLAEGDQAKEQLDMDKASLLAAENQLSQARQNLGSEGPMNAQVLQAVAALESAQLNLSYTQIYASNDGYVTNFSLRQGSTVMAGATLFQLVENKKWWVDANFKETQLTRIRPGEPVTVVLDSYPGIKFKGIVDSISRGSGAAFSLLPPENATGNWVKVTQRFPVKVLITETKPGYPLRVGASSTVTVDTLG